jgi:hypothetical protein
MADQYVLVDLLPARQHHRGDGDAEAAAEIARHVDDGRAVAGRHINSPAAGLATARVTARISA